MSWRPKSAEARVSPPWSPQGDSLWLPAVAVAALLLGTGAFAAEPAFAVLLALAFALGGLFTGVVFWLWLYRPLLRLRSGCRRISSGDLSHTLPEDTTPLVAEIARFNNSLAADFQEILLLFAHLARSALTSARLLQEHVVDDLGADERGRAAEVVEDIEAMQEMIEEFKYFRVRFEGGRIIDTGLSAALGARAPQDAGKSSGTTVSERLELAAVLEGEKP